MRFTLTIIIILLISLDSEAQHLKRLKLKPDKDKFELTSDKGFDGFNLFCSFSDVSIKDTVFYKKNYTSIEVKGLMKIFDAGKPNIPVISKLIEVPQGAKVKIKVVSYEEENINLNDNGFKNPMIPAQVSIRKDQNPLPLKFYFDDKIYSKNTYYNQENIVKYEDCGTARCTRFGRIEISPILYNPVQNTIKILNNISIEVSFINSNKHQTDSLKHIYQSSNFNSFSRKEMINNLPSEKGLITSDAIKYVIVSDPLFKQVLQPFISWKKKKGFQVVEAYTDNPVVGKTSTSIQSYLKDIYLHPPVGEPAPTFVVLVGDVAQIPSFGTRVPGESHFTDLYYFEYTGDSIPDVFYGRFSANTVDELKPQLDKTIEYEQYSSLNHSYLKKALLVAGVANPEGLTYGNGAVNYLNSYYTNPSNGIDTSYTYLYNQGTTPSNGVGAASAIKGNMSNGVGFVTYSAHCNSNGWLDPLFTITDVAKLNNAGKYPVVIGNCCQSAQFDVNCLGEIMMRTANKGAIGYIGATDYTLWDEDYYWGIGSRGVITATPTYDAKHLGSYDRLYHNHGESVSDWYITQSQIIFAGNLAVQSTTSLNKLFYWEVYHLLGDPSLVPYLKTPAPMNISLNPAALLIGSNTLIVKSVPYAHVALSQNGNLLCSKMANSSGDAMLTFNPVSSSQSLDLVITSQNSEPYIGTVSVTEASQPVVIYKSHTTNNAVVYGNTVSLNMTLENMGNLPYNAQNVIATLSSASPYITAITDSTENFGTINAKSVSTKNTAFSFKIANNIPDQQLVTFIVTTRSEYNSQVYINRSSFNLTIDAPTLSILNYSINDPTGNNDNKLDPGEKADLSVIIQNNGHSGIKNIIGSLSLTDGPSTYFDIISSNATIDTIPAGATANLIFQIKSNSSTPMGTKVNLKISTTGGISNQYAVEKKISLPIGIIPEFLMKDTIVTACFGKFYDSGGSLTNYRNNENSVITFNSLTIEGKIKISFTSFDLEDGYDFLYVYDGNSTNSAQIKGSPFTGTSSPGALLSSGSSLTFKFFSDGADTRPGWTADISCFNPTAPPELANSPSPGDGVTGVYPLNLSWVSTDASEFDIYFGTSSTPDFVSTVNSLSYSLKPLSPNTRYFWKIVPKNKYGPAANCPVWSFTTGAPFFIIGNNAVSTCEGKFYDTGGSSGNYQNNEDLTMTISPDANKKRTKLTFSSWNVEGSTNCDYDYLKIYNGPNINSPLMGTFCTVSPGEVISTHSTGALTMHFISDGSATRPGWVADISCEYAKYNVAFQVIDAKRNKLKDVKVVFNNDSIKTDTIGKAVFLKIRPGENLSYQIYKQGYKIIDGTLNITDADLYKEIVLFNETIEDKNFASIRQKDTGGGSAIFSGKYEILFDYLENSNVEIMVSDIMGRRVYHSQLINFDCNVPYDINLAVNQPGIYLLQIKNGNNFINKKLFMR
jgi:hypothetical protein